MPPDDPPHITRAELRDLALVLVAAAFLCGLLCFLHFASDLKGNLMRLLPVVGALALASLAMSGCASVLGAGLPDKDKLPFTDAAMKQFGERCTGHYWGNTGFGAAIGFDVNCKPSDPAQVGQAPPIVPLKELGKAEPVTP